MILKKHKFRSLKHTFNNKLNRRNFIKTISTASLGIMVIGNNHAKTPNLVPKYNSINIRLENGLDWWNLIVPISYKKYYSLRPNLSIPKEETLLVNNLWGINHLVPSLHLAFIEKKALYNNSILTGNYITDQLNSQYNIKNPPVFFSHTNQCNHFSSILISLENELKKYYTDLKKGSIDEIIISGYCGRSLKENKDLGTNLSKRTAIISIKNERMKESFNDAFYDLQ